MQADLGKIPTLSIIVWFDTMRVNIGRFSKNHPHIDFTGATTFFDVCSWILKIILCRDSMYDSIHWNLYRTFSITNLPIDLAHARQFYRKVRNKNNFQVSTPGFLVSHLIRIATCRYLELSNINGRPFFFSEFDLIFSAEIILLERQHSVVSQHIPISFSKLFIERVSPLSKRILDPYKMNISIKAAWFWLKNSSLTSPKFFRLTAIHV